MKCINERTSQIIAASLTMKDTILGRMLGLLTRGSLGEGEGIILKPCVQIHTFFMRFAIDVIFVDAEGRVLHVIENMKPWRVSPLLRHASRTVELRAGTLSGSVKEGDRLVFTL